MRGNLESEKALADQRDLVDLFEERSRMCCKRGMRDTATVLFHLEDLS